MRIVDQIKHPYFKISVFFNNQKYLVKIEDPFFEQCYKFRQDEFVKPLDEIREIVNTAFITKVSAIFKEMYELRKEATSPNLDGE